MKKRENLANGNAGAYDKVMCRIANSCMRRKTNKYCFQKGCKQIRITNEWFVL